MRTSAATRVDRYSFPAVRYSFRGERPRAPSTSPQSGSARGSVWDTSPVPGSTHGPGQTCNACIGPPPKQDDVPSLNRRPSCTVRPHRTATSLWTPAASSAGPSHRSTEVHPCPYLRRPSLVRQRRTGALRRRGCGAPSGCRRRSGCRLSQPVAGQPVTGLPPWLRTRSAMSYGVRRSHAGRFRRARDRVAPDGRWGSAAVPTPSTSRWCSGRGRQPQQPHRQQ